MSVKVGIVSTVREPGNVLLSFIKYHLAIGINHLFIFFDDPNDPARSIAQKFSQVTTIDCDQNYFDQQQQLSSYQAVGKHLNKEVMARQILNAERALHIAGEIGLDWLIHIDVDELFYSPTPVQDHFNFIPYGVGQITYRNLEAAPEKFNCHDYFQEITLFKQHEHIIGPDLKQEYFKLTQRAWHFLGYGNGKSATRVLPGVTPYGVHEFNVTSDRPEKVMAQGGPVILHYINCGFDRYYRKYQQLGKFGDSWFGSIPIPFNFHLKSRDIFCHGSPEEFANFYRDNVLFENPELIEYLLKKGILIKLTKPSQILATQII